MEKHIRIFISSPGDVIEERDRARQVVETLRRRYAARLRLQPVLWEDLPLTADMSFQQGIELVLSAERGIDLAVFILWSRLGSPLGPRVKRPDGTEYRSGTEREWHLMLEARAQSGGQRPDLLVYTRQDEPSFEERLRGQPTDRKTELLGQKKLAETFIAEEFHDAEKGTNVRAYHTFDRPVTFSQRLRVHLQELLDARAGVTPAEPVWDIEKSGPPFLGLAAFQPQHAPVFFGREDEILEVRQTLRQQACDGCAFVLIAGASGSGKSSLARAGVLPAIVEHEIDAQVHAWRTLLCTPGELGADPLTGLAARLAADSALSELRGGESAIADLAEGLRKDPALTFRLVLAPALDRAAEKAGGPVRLLVLVDQLEELLSNPALSAADRDAFAAALEALARSGRVWVLATMRADFFAACQGLEPLRRMRAGRGQCDLLPPSPGALRRLIEEPARLAGLSFEEKEGTSLADRILADAAGHAELLPLVEHLLADLCAHRTAEGVLTFARYAQVGGVSGSLAGHAGQTYGALDEEARAALGAVLQRLVTVSGDDEKSFVRQRVPWVAFSSGAQRRLVEAFVQARLFTAHDAAPGASDPGAAQGAVTIAHEALLRVWPPAQAWVEANADFLRVRSRVEARMKQGGLLLEGDPLLEAARHHLAAAPEGFTPEQRRYVEESHARIQSARRRREQVRRNVVVALSVLTLLAFGAALWAWRKQRDETEARELAFKKNAELESAKRALLNNLHEASMADYAVAVQRIEKDSKWHEGVAHLARALKWEPGNALVATRLYSTLSLYAAEKQDWPRLNLRHEDFVWGAQFSPDGSRIVTASEDKTARVWDAATGQPLGEPLRHEGIVISAHFSHDGTRIVTASEDNTARVWDAATGQPLSEPLRHEKDVSSAQFSPDGSRIVTASSDKTARVWDVATGHPLGEPLRHEDAVSSAHFSPDGALIVTASWDQTARLWTATGESLGEPLRHEEAVSSAHFSPDGARLVTASRDKTARVWDVSTGEPLGEPLRHGDVVRNAQFSPDGTRILTECDDQTARVWDAATGQPLGRPLRHEGKLRSAFYSPDGSRIVTASIDRTARVWDAATGQPLGESLRHEEGVISAQFSPDGSRIVTASSDARVWDAATRLPLGELFHHDGEMTGAEFSPDGSRFVTASMDKTARVWDAATGQPLGQPLRHENPVTSAHFSADGSHIVTASGDGTARVWDAATSRPLGEPLRHKNVVNSAEFSPDGSRIVTASYDANARVWDAATGQALGAPLRHEKTVDSAHFSPDGSRIVTASEDKTARVWDATTGQPLSEPLRHDNFVNSAQFSPDGSLIVTASDDKTGRVWDAATGRPLGEPLHHDHLLISAQFSPDGFRIVTASEDKTARVWDAATAQPLGEPLRHEDIVWSAQFSADGFCILTASGDKTARVWDAATGQPLGEPLRHEESVISAQFSPDGSRIVTASWDRTARVWDSAKLVRPPVPFPEWMLARAWAIAGLEFDVDGQMKAIPGERRRAVLLEPPPPGDDAWSKLARWLVQPAHERTLTPDSRFTARQIAERERDSGYKEGLESALRYDPAVPLAHILLAEALLKEDARKEAKDRDPSVPERAAFLRRHGLKLLPEDAALCARAASSLAAQKDYPLALKTADKALALDPKNAAALQARAAAMEGMKGK